MHAQTPDKGSAQLLTMGKAKNERLNNKADIYTIMMELGLRKEQTMISNLTLQY